MISGGALKAYFGPLKQNVTSPAYLGTMAILGIGLWASSRYLRGPWRATRFICMGALGAGVGFGLLAPLVPPLRVPVMMASAASAAAAATPTPVQSRSATNKSFEPAQGVEGAGVFVGQ